MGPSNVQEMVYLFGFPIIAVSLGPKMESWRVRRWVESFLEVVRFVVAKYGTVRSHGDLIHARIIVLLCLVRQPFFMIVVVQNYGASVSGQTTTFHDVFFPRNMVLLCSAKQELVTFVIFSETWCFFVRSNATCQSVYIFE